jgi:hypothetical protein
MNVLSIISPISSQSLSMSWPCACRKSISHLIERLLPCGDV